MKHEKYHVATTALNLRSAPVVDRRNRLDVLPEGQIVDKIAEAPTGGWWEVSTVRNGIILTGFVSCDYLSPAAGDGPDILPGPIASHLKPKIPVRRDQANWRTYPLNESGMPRRWATTEEARAQQITDIVHWLDVERSARYLREGDTTFSHVYVYDLAYLCGVYVPRVWWNERSLDEITCGKMLTPMYDVTVREMSVNGLADWFGVHGEYFGWKRENDLTRLQHAANRGEVCIVVAQGSDSKQPGHICAVIPETIWNEAKREGDQVVIPLQSQAGSENYRYNTVDWWRSADYSKIDFWRIA